MIFLIFTLDIILLIIAALHFLWALGIWWPIRDQAQLARTIAGAKGITKMPPKLASLAVAIAVIIAAAWPWLLPYLPRWFYLLGLAALVAVFTGRGLVTYTKFWRRIWPEQPFATLDRKYFGPLCLYLGIGFMVILIAS